MAKVNYALCLKHVALFLFEILKAAYWSLIPASYRRAKNLENQLVLVTGSAGGLGRCLALKFAELGCRIVLMDVDASALEETRSFLEERYGTLRVSSYVCDVSNRAAVYEVARKVKEREGILSVLVNNAGIANGKYFLDLSEEEIEKVIGVNLMASYWTTKAFLPDMVKRRRGHLVYVSSGIALAGAPSLSDYGSSKWAVAGFVESLRQEGIVRGWTGVEFTTVFPSLTKTSLYNADKYDGLIFAMNPHYVANEIVRGVLVGRQSIYVPGALWLLSLLKPFLSSKALVHMQLFTTGPAFFDDKISFKAHNDLDK